MTLQVTYDRRAERGVSEGGIVTEEAGSVSFDDQGRVKFTTKGGSPRRLDPVYVLEINAAGDAGGWL